MATKDFSADEARRSFIYDPDTGEMKRNRPGSKPFRALANGYLVCGYRGKSYQVHRIAWLIVHGHWPKHEIDHINRIKTDNRIHNLRDVPRALNVRNSHRVKFAPLIGPVPSIDGWTALVPKRQDVRQVGAYACAEDALQATSTTIKRSLSMTGKRPSRSLPRRVYEKHGSYWYVSHENKWIKLCRIDDGEAQMLRALADFVDNQPKV